MLPNARSKWRIDEINIILSIHVFVQHSIYSVEQTHEVHKGQIKNCISNTLASFNG